MDWADPRLLGLALSTPQVYALFFLLGSFVVASLSDLRHLSAQREFAEVWGAFVVVLAAVELWDLSLEPDLIFGAKWGLILVLGALSLDRVGVLFRLAPGDVLAIAAAASLLSPLLILLFFGVLKLASWPAARLLARGNAYPFLPVVTAATLAILAAGMLLD